MYLSTNESYFATKFGTGEVRSLRDRVKICAFAGFKYIDVSLCGSRESLNPASFDDCVDRARALREYCDGMGVSINQTHAPFVYQLKKDPLCMERAVEVSAILGADNMVIHADASVSRDGIFSTELDLKKICEFYAPYAELAAKRGIHLAVENLFEEDTSTGERKRFTSTVEEQIAVIEYLGPQVMTACWDFGHGRVTYGDGQIEALKKVRKYLAATHVHDNMIGRDLHQHVFCGGTDWIEIMKYLHETGYDKGFTFEMVYGKLPDELVTDFLKFQKKVGDYMITSMK